MRYIIACTVGLAIALLGYGFHKLLAEEAKRQGYDLDANFFAGQVVGYPWQAPLLELIVACLIAFDGEGGSAP